VRQPAVRFDDLPPISVVLLSHNHYDHCDLPTLRRLAQRFDPLVVTPLGNGARVRSTGIRRVEELDWWQSAATSPLPVALTPAQHFSARSPFDRNRALWSGFVCQADRLCIYFAGDTAYAPFLNDVQQRGTPNEACCGPPQIPSIKPQSLQPLGRRDLRTRFERALAPRIASGDHPAPDRIQRRGARALKEHAWKSTPHARDAHQNSTNTVSNQRRSHHRCASARPRN
jgi:hypothetical protein